MKVIPGLLILASCISANVGSLEMYPLDDITLNGRFIYEYDVACWIATDSVMTLKPDQSKLGYYFADNINGLWVVHFGKLSEQGEFVSVYRVKFNSDFKVDDIISKDTTISKYTGFIKAIGTSSRDFTRQNVVYNYVVKTDTSNTISVYLIPAQTNPDIYPLGGDVHYVLNQEGNLILKKRPLHKTILQMPRMEKPGGTSFSTAILTSTPTETDVFYVLRQNPRHKHMVTTRKFMYVINEDGSINQGGENK